MDSVLKFLIKLQANEGNVVSVARRTQGELQKIERTAGSVGVRLKEAFSFSNFKNSLMSIPGMSFLLNPYALGAAAIGTIAKLGGEAQMTASAFTVLAGSEEKAGNMLQEIGKFANETPFSKLDLVENAKQMLSFGVSTEKVLPYLKQLGDISGGNKERLSSLSLVMGQVVAAGKLAGQDNLQFINAGFNPLKELQKMTGKSYQELQEMMSKGQITAENVAQAIAHATGESGDFYGMMDKLSKTFSGKLSTAIGQAQERIVGLFDKIAPLLVSAIDAISAIMPIVATAIEALFDVIAGGVKFIQEFSDYFVLAGIVVGVFTAVIQAQTIALTVYKGVQFAVAGATKVWTGVQWLLNAALSANPIGLVVAGIAALVAGVVYCWYKFAGFRAFLLTMWDTIKGFGTILKEYVIDRIKGLLEGIGALGSALKNLFAGNFSQAWEDAKKGVRGIIGVDATVNAVAGTKNLVTSSWQKNYAEQQAKQSEKGSKDASISTPKLSGSNDNNIVFGKAGAKSGKDGSSKTSNSIATGGTRNTQITMNISKFFDYMNVAMNDKADTSEVEKVVLQSLNRALAIATSTDR